MTQEEVMQTLTDMGLHEGGMANWVADNAWWKFANVVAQHEREKFCAVLRQLHDSYSLASDSNAIKAALEAKDEQLREENERLHVENRRLIDRIETIGVPVGVGGFVTTTSSQRTWVGLTYEDMVGLQKQLFDKNGEIVLPTTLAMAVEAKLKEKNT